MDAHAQPVAAAQEAAAPEATRADPQPHAPLKVSQRKIDQVKVRMPQHHCHSSLCGMKPHVSPVF